MHQSLTGLQFRKTYQFPLCSVASQLDVTTIYYIYIYIYTIVTTIPESFKPPNYVKRSTDYGAKSRPDGEDFLSVNQVCISCQMSIVYLRVLKVKNTTNRL